MILVQEELMITSPPLPTTTTTTMTSPAQTSPSSSSSSSIKSRKDVLTQHKVHILSTQDDKSNIVPALSKLSAATEMKSYGAEQWKFLLRAPGVEALVIYRPPAGAAAAAAANDTEKDLWGCVLRIPFGSSHCGYGMMLVSREARGQGLGRKLLETAMKKKNHDDDDHHHHDDALHILGTCTEMGRPMYEKMGFRRVSTVTKMSVDMKLLSFSSEQVVAAAASSSSSSNNNKMHIVEDSSSSESAAAILDELLALDRHATGLDRSDILRAIEGYPYVSTATIVDDAHQDKVVLLAAMLTQYPNSSSTVVVGPIVGQEPLVPMLLQGIRDYYQHQSSRNTDGSEARPKAQTMSLIVSDHESLVETLAEAGFETQFQLGAMTSHGGRPFPGNRQSYLALIHPTLG